MGRSGGGSFGGGGFSGGFSGGGRMSGGFSGGSGFGGGRSGIPSSGGHGSPMFGGGYGGGFGGSGFWSGFLIGQLMGDNRSMGDPAPPSGQPVDPQGSRPASSNSQAGCGSCLTVIAIFLAATLLVMAFMAIMDLGGCSSQLTGGSTQASTVERTALSSDMVIETPYFSDDDGDWIGDPQTLTNGMREFYMETGVQPYLHILPNGSERTVNALTTIAETEYGQLFQDEAHFLVVFCDNGYGGFGVGYCVGSAAKTVMDSEAIAIFQDYLDRYYNDYSISESEIFANTYVSTADRIMTTDAERNAPIVIVLIAGIVVVIVVAGIVVIVRRRAKTREAELKHQQEVLSTPLEKFDDDDIEETARKYEQGRAAVNGTQQPSSSGAPGSPNPNDLERFGDADLAELERKYSSGQSGQPGVQDDANSTNRQQ